MTGHILTGKIIPASCHAVYLPNTPGLSRASQAFFFSPSPNTDIRPPISLNIESGIPEDSNYISPEIGFKNWKEGM